MTGLNHLMLRASIYFTAGCIGGLVNSVFAWFFGVSGINALLGISLAPAFTSTWLYLRLVWGGIWGFLFLLPVLEDKPLYVRALLFSLVPCSVQLFVVFPFKLGKGYMGLELGMMAPMLVLLLNLVWAYTTGLWIRYAVSGRPVGTA